MKNNLKKIIIPVAGLGTRMLPATKAIPKEMLPILNKPIIQYVVEEAIEAGFDEIVLITHSSKSSIEDHFDKSFELESVLEKRVQRNLLKEIKAISKLKVYIHSIRQEEPKGLGHAILCAKKIIGNHPFAISLPDMLIDCSDKTKNLNLMKSYFEKTNNSSLLLGKISKSEISKYGVAKIKSSKIFDPFVEIQDVIEKPSQKKAPSNLFAVGRYVFSNEFMKYLEKALPDINGEIQLTDAIRSFLKDKNQLLGLKLQGNYYDCGEKLGFLKANYDLAKKDPLLRKGFLKHIKKN